MFGEVVRSYRERANLTQSELAELTGIHRTVLSRIESGETRRPGFATCRSIANALHIPYDMVISHYLDISQRAETLKELLAEAVAHSYKHAVRKAAEKWLHTPKSDPFLALDHLLQVARETEDADIKLTLYEVIIAFTRTRGITYYLAKSLLERYLIERDDFSRLEETYQRGKELLHYVEFLQPYERFTAYYKMAVHAYVLDYYQECIELSQKSIHEDSTDCVEKASALMCIAVSYLLLGDLILAEQYIKQYETSAYADSRGTHMRALLCARKKQYDEAIRLFQECLANGLPHQRMNVASDLMDVCLECGREEMIATLIQSEEDFLSGADFRHPNNLKNLAIYYKQKGRFQFTIGNFEEGFSSLMDSISYYHKIGDYQQVNENICQLLDFHRSRQRNLPFEYMEKIINLCNNRDKIRRRNSA